MAGWGGGDRESHSQNNCQNRGHVSEKSWDVGFSAGQTSQELSTPAGRVPVTRQAAPGDEQGDVVRGNVTLRSSQGTEVYPVEGHTKQ